MTEYQPSVEPQPNTSPSMPVPPQVNTPIMPSIQAPYAAPLYQGPLVEFRQVFKQFGHKTALNGATFQIGRGRVVGLLGPNGSGKTTCIKLLNGLLQPTSGQVLINGSAPSPATKAVVSYLPDTTYLDDNWTVHKAIRYFKDFYLDFDEQRAYHLLSDLAIDPANKLKELSKGNKEKVQLILVMSRRAQLYILDEPIGGVDPATRDYILHTIISNYSPNSTVLITTHLIADVEQILDDIIFIKDSNIVRIGNVDDLRAQSGGSIDQLFRQEFRTGGY